MVDLICEADIRCPAERIFDCILDFGGQDGWLSKSSSYRGTTEVSSNPVKLGTTYREPGPFGVRNGEVIELERPTKVTFHQPMTFILGLGTVDVVVRIQLTRGGASTHVRRHVSLGIPWPLKLLQPILALAFSRESRRTLMAVKAHADGLG